MKCVYASTRVLQCIKRTNTNTTTLKCLLSTSSSSSTSSSTPSITIKPNNKKLIDEPYMLSREKFADSRNKRLANMLRKSAKKEEKVLTNAIDNIRLNELKTIVKEKGFIVIDEESTDNVILKKKVNNLDIVVEFNSIDSSSTAEDSQRLEDYLFEVLIRMPLKNKAINFTCIPFPSLLPISIRILDPLLENTDNGNNNNNDDNYIDDNDEKAIIEYFLNELTGDPSLYDGPTILELPEKLQAELLTYLNRLGIDEALTEYIIKYSKMKHSKEKVISFQKLASFVEFNPSTNMLP